MVDVGAFGRRSDGGIFRDSKMGKMFRENRMNVPAPEPLTADGPPVPYVLVGDEAFQLSTYMMRPYPGRGGLTKDKTIYNYRLSRARRVIENTFGILVTLRRILKKPIEADIDCAVAMVKAILCLHNWITKQDTHGHYVSEKLVDRHDSHSFTPGQWREEIENSALRSTAIYNGCIFSSRLAAADRDEFRDFFFREGAVPWQYGRK